MHDVPTRELEQALESGELDVARTAARRCREVSLDLALRLLPLAALEEPEAYDERALRWFVRWLAETPDATLAQAAEIARALVYVPSDPSAMEMIQAMSAHRGRER